MNELVNANEVITEINDEYRRRTRTVTLTSGVAMLPDVSELLEAVALFDDFTEDDDPNPLGKSNNLFIKECVALAAKLEENGFRYKNAKVYVEEYLAIALYTLSV